MAQYFRYVCVYQFISNTVKSRIQYAPQTFNGEPWENVSLAVQYAPECTMPPVAVNAVYAVGDINKGSLVQRSRSRQSETNWQ